MKRMLAILLIGMLLIGALTGCAKRKAAAEPAMQLDMVQMVETAKGETKKAAQDDSLQAQVHAPDTYQFEATSEKGNLRVFVDAKVTLPEADALPIARMQQISFTERDVKHFADVLLGKDAQYINSRGDGSLVETKAFLTRELWYFQHCIELGVYDDMKYESVEELYPIVEEFRKRIETAPTEFATIEPDFSIQPVSGMEESASDSVRLWTAPDNATISELDILNAERLSRITYIRDGLQGAALSNNVQISVYDPANGDVSKLLRISEQDALAIAEQTVRALGFSGLACSGKRQHVYEGVYDAEQHGIYEFMYTPAVNGVPVAFTNENQASNRAWDYERLRIYVDNDGVLWMRYNHPCEVTEVLTGRAALLPFSEIQRVFEQLILVTGGDYGSNILEHDRTGSLDITGVRLGLMTLPDTASSGTALVIPVWDFFGVYTREDAEWGDTVMGRDGYTSLFTVNAIDGTVISRERGR